VRIAVGSQVAAPWSAAKFTTDAPGYENLRRTARRKEAVAAQRKGLRRAAVFLGATILNNSHRLWGFIANYWNRSGHGVATGVSYSEKMTNKRNAPIASCKTSQFDRQHTQERVRSAVKHGYGKTAYGGITTSRMKPDPRAPRSLDKRIPWFCRPHN